MARSSRGSNDSDFNILNNDKGLEETARRAKQLTDDVLDHVDRRFESLRQKMNRNMEKEVSGIQKEIARIAEEQKQSRQQDPLRDRAVTSLLRQVGEGKKYDPSTKNMVLGIARELATGIERAISTYFMKPYQEGFSQMSSAYEQNFTAIASRMGTDRSQTFQEMRNAVTTLTSSVAKSAVDANQELIPELRRVAESGFRGQEAISIALSNSIDKKIMPWLDTASVAWTNLQANLSEGQLKQLKAQQLALQETKSGNRLLQSGVINSLQNDLQPLLANIDYNTVDLENLPAQTQQIMQAFVEQGFTPQEAYQEAVRALNVYKSPASGFESGKYSDVIRAAAAVRGGSPIDIAKADVYGLRLGAQAGLYASLVTSALGIQSASGVYRPEALLRQEQAVRSIQEPAAVATSLYTQAAEDVAEKVSATAAWDISRRNVITGAAYTLNNWPHGVDTVMTIKDTVTNILKVMVGWGIGKIAFGAIGKSGIGSKLSGLFGGGGAVAGSQAAGAVGEAAAGALPAGYATTSSGLIVPEAAAAVPQAAGAAAGISAGTLAGIAGGIAGGAYGIATGISDIAEGEHKTRGGISIAGGAAALGGSAALGAAALGVGAANVWNPVGWVLLAGGGLAVLGTALHRYATTISESEKTVKENMKSISEAYNQEAKDRKESARSIVDEMIKTNDSTESEQQARNFLVEQGVISTTEAQEKSAAELKKLTLAYAEAQDVFMSKDIKGLSEKASDIASRRVRESESEAEKGLEQSITDALSKSQKLIRTRGGRGYVVSSLYDEAGAETETYNLIKLLQSKAAGTEYEQRLYDITHTDSGELRKDVNKQSILGLVSTLKSKGIITPSSYAASAKSWGLSAEYSIPDISSSELEIENYVSAIRNILAARNTASDEELAGLFQQLSSYGAKLTDKEKADLKNEIPLLTNIYDNLKIRGAKNLPEKYAVGSPYITEDKLAFLHKGEAVLTAEENSTALRNLLGVSSQQTNATYTSATEVVNAILAQTESLKTMMNIIIETISKRQPIFATGGLSLDNSMISMDPSIANSKPIYR